MLWYNYPYFININMIGGWLRIEFCVWEKASICLRFIHTTTLYNILCNSLFSLYLMHYQYHQACQSISSIIRFRSLTKKLEHLNSIIHTIQHWSNMSQYSNVQKYSNSFMSMIFLFNSMEHAQGDIMLVYVKLSRFHIFDNLYLVIELFQIIWISA